VWAADLKAGGQPPAPLPVLITEVGEDSASDVASVMGPDGDLVSSRLARGCRCFAARLGQQVVAYGWLSTSREWIGEVELEIAPHQGEAYIWNCATDTEYRRRGFFGAIVKSITAQARTEGLKRVWIGSLDIPASKAVAQAGFVPAIHFTSVWMYGMRWLRVRPAGGVDPRVELAAREVLAVGGRPLRLGSSMKRAQHRRH
jgi:GNAT superfamily N-acetyltransferase